MPLPIGNGEQRLNAQPVVEAGGGLLVDDADLTADWVRRAAAALLTDPDGSPRWARPPPRIGRRDADERLADLVREAAAGRRGGAR